MHYFSEPNIFSTFIERNVRLTNDQILIGDNPRIFGKDIQNLTTRRTAYLPIISISAHNLFIEEILPLALHHLIHTENLDLSHLLKYIEYETFYKDVSELHFPSQKPLSVHKSQPQRSSPSERGTKFNSQNGIKIEDLSQPILGNKEYGRGLGDSEANGSIKNYEIDAMKSLIQSPHIYVFLSKLAIKSQGKLKYFEAKLNEMAA